MTESAVLSPASADCCKRVDEVWVPTQFHVRSGVSYCSLPCSPAAAAPDSRAVHTLNPSLCQVDVLRRAGVPAEKVGVEDARACTLDQSMWARACVGTARCFTLQ